MRTVAVIDIGKTNAKVALVDLATLAETVVARMANTAVREAPYAHFDVDGLWDFILDGLAQAARQTMPDAIAVTTHGVAVALLDENGGLAMPVLDYEDAGPGQAAAYDAVRPPFAETGTPRLPAGLNLAAQLFWQQTTLPEPFAAIRSIVPYPQYWAWRLSGVLATEVTSLGCHTDLWNPSAGDYSTLVDAMGWRKLMPPLRRASDVLGEVKTDIAALCGLAAKTPVLCGIHDSNASLYPHLLAREDPFAVVSTGTWVVVMAVGGAARALGPTRDTLVNVNALGHPVPSARFMGGREFSRLLGETPIEPSAAEIGSVLATPVLLTPSVEPGSGPFPGRKSAWLPSQDMTPGERFAVVSFYLAMMTATCLDLIGARGDIVVEGPFGANRLFTEMLATAAGRDVVEAKGSTGTSVGAALLCAAAGSPSIPQKAGTRVAPNGGWAGYARRWSDAVRSRD